MFIWLFPAARILLKPCAILKYCEYSLAFSAGTFTFNYNGTAVQEGTITFEGESETESDAFTWENASSNPNFNSTTQNYIWYGEDSISATFSSDFNTVTIRDEEGSEVVCTRN